jgi:hypothetical protein
VSHPFDISGVNVVAGDRPVLVMTLHSPGKPGFAMGRYVGEFNELKEKVGEIFDTVVKSLVEQPAPPAQPAKEVDSESES